MKNNLLSLKLYITSLTNIVNLYTHTHIYINVI